MGKKTDGNTFPQLMPPAKGLPFMFKGKVHLSVTVMSCFPMYQQCSCLIKDFFLHSCRRHIDINIPTPEVLKEHTKAGKIPPEVQAKVN